MADNLISNPGVGGDTIAAKDIAGVKYQRGIITDPSGNDLTPLTDAQLRATAVPVSGPLTDAELRAAAVPVSMPSTTITGSVAVTGPLTDAQLRASAVQVVGGATSNPLPNAAGAVVRQAPQDVWQASFSNVNASALSEPQLTQRRLGTGVTISQAAGNLAVAAGTTPNSEWLARSVQSFRGAMIARHKTILSQRIANNNFAVLLADLVGEGLSCTINSATSITVTRPAHGFTAENIGQFINVGAINGANGVPGRYAIASVPDANNITFTVAGWPASGSCTVDLFGRNYFRTLYTGTNALQANVDAQRNGWASGDTVATINTTASPGHVMQTHVDGRNAYWSDTLVASSVAPTVTVRASRIEVLPDDDVELYVYLWLFNGTVAPASSTTWTVGFVAVEDLANVPVYLAGTRQNGFAAPLPVVFPAAQAVSQSGTWNVTVNAAIAAGTNAIGDVGVQYRATTTGAASNVAVQSPATPAAATIKGSAGRLVGWYLQNGSAGLRSVKVFNATAPTLGVTSAAFCIDIPAGGVAQLQFPGGVAFSTAMTYSVTSAKGLTDNTSAGLAANDVSGFFSFA